MKRPSITIETQNGVSYDANHLSIELKFEEGGTVGILSFICSGSRINLDPKEIKEIRFSPNGATWCGFCDQPLMIIGKDIYKID